METVERNNHGRNYNDQSSIHLKGGKSDLTGVAKVLGQMSDCVAFE
jgi:hypothetical protein